MLTWEKRLQSLDPADKLSLKDSDLEDAELTMLNCFSQMYQLDQCLLMRGRHWGREQKYNIPPMCSLGKKVEIFLLVWKISSYCVLNICLPSVTHWTYSTTAETQVVITENSSLYYTLHGEDHGLGLLDHCSNLYSTSAVGLIGHPCKETIKLIKNWFNSSSQAFFFFSSF